MAHTNTDRNQLQCGWWHAIWRDAVINRAIERECQCAAQCVHLANMPHSHWAPHTHSLTHSSHSNSRRKIVNSATKSATTDVRSCACVCVCPLKNSRKLTFGTRRVHCRCCECLSVVGGGGGSISCVCVRAYATPCLGQGKCDASGAHPRLSSVDGDAVQCRVPPARELSSCTGCDCAD